MQLNAKLCFFILLCSSVTNLYALPSLISAPGEKVIVFDPREHAWGAYLPDGRLLRQGLASGGKDWCKDMHQPCHTHVGSFRIRSLGSAKCVSPSFPVPKGGSPMPYCMYYSREQALHGSYNVVSGNISHGCIRVHVNDAKWIRNNFAELGTLVVVRPY